jgi:hypothetical protein
MLEECENEDTNTDNFMGNMKLEKDVNTHTLFEEGNPSLFHKSAAKSSSSNSPKKAKMQKSPNKTAVKYSKSSEHQVTTNSSDHHSDIMEPDVVVNGNGHTIAKIPFSMLPPQTVQVTNIYMYIKRLLKHEIKNVMSSFLSLSL